MEWSTVPLVIEKLNTEMAVIRDQNRKLRDEVMQLKEDIKQEQAANKVEFKDCRHCGARNTGLNCEKCVYAYLFENEPE